MKIKKKKMFKSKHLFFAPFSSKTGDFFCIDGKIPKFCHKYFSSEKFYFFGDFGQKTGIAGPIIFKLSTKRNQVLLKKNLENENFMRTAVHCENWYFKKTNICHYFPSMDLPPNIWSIQLVPFYNPCIWSLFNPLFPQNNIVIINSKLGPTF